MIEKIIEYATTNTVNGAVLRGMLEALKQGQENPSDGPELPGDQEDSGV